jgi:mono/diheme cytochrome c family protein
MSKRPFVIFGILAAIAVIVLPLVALGKEGGEDAATVQVTAEDRTGQEIVSNNCRQCHTLAAAGIQGVVGPDLDQLLVPSGTNSAESFEGNYARVLRAINCGVEGRMPKGILQGEEAQEAAAFVAAYAGQIGKGPAVDISEQKLAPPPSCTTG